MKARVNHINRSNHLLKTMDDDILIQRKHSTDPFHIPHSFYHDYITTLIIRASGIQRSTISTKLSRSRDYRRIVHRLLSFDWGGGG